MNLIKKSVLGIRKPFIAFLGVSLITLTMAGCAPGENTPGSTVVGAAAGGLLGGAIFGGSAAGIVGGALLGGGLGYMVGRSMDRQDQINMSNAVVDTPVGQSARWTNESTHVTYVVEPVNEYHRGRRRCRRYRTRVRIPGKGWRTAYGTVCHVPGRGWHIVN